MKKQKHHFTLAFEVIIGNLVPLVFISSLLIIMFMKLFISSTVANVRDLTSVSIDQLSAKTDNI